MIPYLAQQVANREGPNEGEKVYAVEKDGDVVHVSGIRRRSICAGNFWYRCVFLHCAFYERRRRGGRNMAGFQDQQVGERSIIVRGVAETRNSSRSMFGWRVMPVYDTWANMRNDYRSPMPRKHPHAPFMAPLIRLRLVFEQ